MPFGRPYGQNAGFSCGRFSGLTWDPWFSENVPRLKATTVRDPSGNILMTEAGPGWLPGAEWQWMGSKYPESFHWKMMVFGPVWNYPSGWPWIVPRHFGRAVTVLCDGHAQAFTETELGDRRLWLVRE